jgi:phospholipid/cholesterol/gamma-HCH transport system permease protein
MFYLAAITFERGIQRPWSWAAEFVTQLRFTVKVCFLPMVLTAFALSYGPVGIQASNFFALFGSLDRLGSVYELTVIRLFAPMIVGIVLSGAAGTAICADLGARVIREEVDALRVLGVDPVKSLVVPRVLVLIVAALLFDAFAILAGILGLIAVAIQNGQALGPVFSTFFSNATPLELEASIVTSARSSRSSAATRASTCPAGLRRSAVP